jgi:hypothetical protein
LLLDSSLLHLIEELECLIRSTEVSDREDEDDPRETDATYDTCRPPHPSTIFDITRLTDIIPLCHIV